MHHGIWIPGSTYGDPSKFADPSECDCDPTLGYPGPRFSNPMGLWGINGLEGR